MSRSNDLQGQLFGQESLSGDDNHWPAHSHRHIGIRVAAAIPGLTITEEH